MLALLYFLVFEFWIWLAVNAFALPSVETWVRLLAFVYSTVIATLFGIASAMLIAGFDASMFIGLAIYVGSMCLGFKLIYMSIVKKSWGARVAVVLLLLLALSAPWWAAFQMMPRSMSW